MSVKANICPEGEVLEGSTPWLFETAGDVEDGYDYGDDVKRPYFVQFQRFDHVYAANNLPFGIGIIHIPCPHRDYSLEELRESIHDIVLRKQFGLHISIQRFLGTNGASPVEGKKWWKKPMISVRWDKAQILGESHLDVELTEDFDLLSALEMMDRQIGSHNHGNACFVASWDMNDSGVAQDSDEEKKSAND